jgi:hypothetical protein
VTPPEQNQSRLTASDCALILTKHQASRMGFAVLLAFFRERGRFPRRPAEIDRAMIRDIVAQLDLEHAADRSTSLSGRSVERHRAEIRNLFGFREATDGSKSRLPLSARTRIA